MGMPAGSLNAMHSGNYLKIVLLFSLISAKMLFECYVILLWPYCFNYCSSNCCFIFLFNLCSFKQRFCRTFTCYSQI